LENGIYKSTDSGGTWTAMNTGLSGLSVKTFAISPVTPSTVYTGVIGGGVCRSDDGGAHWTPINGGLTYLNVIALVLDPVTHMTLYAGTAGGGVFVLH
jgi:hypothetical protein